MSSQIPYQLRPNKYVDRALFLDLLSRATLFRGPESYVYISMGGKHLVDHRLVFQRVGVADSVSFDNNEKVVRRQKFNLPGGSTLLQCMNSSEISDLIETLDDLYLGSPNYIVWLDYVTGRERKSQFDEFLSLLTVSRPYDIIRVTFSAEASSLDYEKEEIAERYALKRLVNIRAARLRLQLGRWMPSDVESISDQNFGSVLLKCLELVVSEAERRMRTISFRPLLLTEYADGARMVTACVQALPRGDENLISASRALSHWEYLARGWGDIHKIKVPDLSIKEKEFLDAESWNDPVKVCNKIGFEFDEDEKKSAESIKSYWKYSKYYPTFRAVEV